jgi:hypothetical protein
VAEFDINDIASIGSVRDVPGYLLPPEAWSVALNMRYRDEGLEALMGWAQVFGTPLHTSPDGSPHFHMSVANPTQNLWLYTSLKKAAAYDGVNHADVTRSVGGDYTAVDTYQWNGTMLGGIAIVNNGNDVPQSWPTATLATRLVNLPNWPANLRAKVIRAFGPFLVAINITEASVTFPHRVRWSHPADPGSVPSSWDVTNPAVDAGELDLPDVDSGTLVDMLPLGSNMYLYKESAIWRMRYVGGQQIFDVGQAAWLTTSGLLGPRCVCVTGDGQKHVFATQDDIMWHNGNTVQSILNKRQRTRLQNEIDTNFFFKSFMFANPFNNEVWFCYPAAGSADSDPFKALILNYKTAGGDSFTITEADGITWRNAVAGNLEAFTPEIWDKDAWVNSNTSAVPPFLKMYIAGDIAYDGVSNEFYLCVLPITSPDAPTTFAQDRVLRPGFWTLITNTAGLSDTWDSDTGPWSKLERRRVIMSSPLTNKFYKLDEGGTRDGTAVSTLLQREGLGIMGQKKDGTAINDFQRMKMLKRVWPKISTLSGGTINIRFGSQQVVDGATMWGSSVPFNPDINVWADPGPATGRAIAVEFSKVGSWRIDGYKVDVVPLGVY